MSLIGILLSITSALEVEMTATHNNSLRSHRRFCHDRIFVVSVTSEAYAKGPRKTQTAGSVVLWLTLESKSYHSFEHRGRAGQSTVLRKPRPNEASGRFVCVAH